MSKSGSVDETSATPELTQPPPIIIDQTTRYAKAKNITTKNGDSVKITVSDNVIHV